MRSEPRQWLWLGLWGGIGLETKYTIVVPLVAFAVGCVLWRRDLLRCREAALVGLVAIALIVPNAIWQGTHGWISADFASSRHTATAADGPLAYAAQQLAFLGVGAVLVILGLVCLWRRPHLRPLALTSAAPSILFGLEQGRSYYALPAMLPALVAGCLALAERSPRRAVLVALGVHRGDERQHERQDCEVDVDRTDARGRCTRTTVLALIGNRWGVGNEERGRPLIWCRRRAPLGSLWERSFATAQL